MHYHQLKTFPPRLPIPSYDCANRWKKKFIESVKFKLCNHLFQLTHQFKLKVSSQLDGKKFSSFALRFQLEMPSWLCETNGVFVTGWTWCFSDILHFPINHTLMLRFFCITRTETLVNWQQANKLKALHQEETLMKIPFMETCGHRVAFVRY